MTADPPPGYRLHPLHDPFEDHVGPLWMKDDGGELAFAFRALGHHCNTSGTVHGGMLATFADFLLCAAGSWGTEPEERCVTVTLDSQFLAPVAADELVEGEAQILQRTRKLVFARARLFVGERSVAAFSAVLRRFPR